MTELIGESDASLSALCYTSNVITQLCRTKECGGGGDLGHFLKLKKIQTLRTQTYHISF